MGYVHDNTQKKKWKQLNEKERYKIEALLKAGFKAKEIAEQLGRDRRTIEREIRRGTVIQRRENPYASRNPKVKDYLDEYVYLADVGQRRAEENARNKGRGLKIGHDHRLARYIEKRIKEDKLSPDAVIGEIKEKGLKFEIMLCTKTVYNMIDRGDFLNLINGSSRETRRNRTLGNGYCSWKYENVSIGDDRTKKPKGINI